MNILAFSGRKQSGKSTSADYVADFIKKMHPNKICQIYSFADPLKKDICMNILGLSYDQCYGSDENKNTLTDLVWEGEKLTARRAMEVIGTDIFRKLMNDVWVRATVIKIKQDNPDLAIIPDCRFPNEVDTLINNNAYVIRLTLDPFNSISNSETALDKDKYDWEKFSLIIDNNQMTIDKKNQIIIDFLHDRGVLPL